MKRIKYVIASAVLAISLLSSTVALAAGTPGNVTVEGNATYFVTGESFASSITFAGYNSRDKKMYVNFTAETTKIVTALTPTFNYDINVFDGTSTSLGNLGSYAVPETLEGTLAASTAQATNKDVVLDTPLTANYSLVVTIDTVTLTP